MKKALLGAFILFDMALIGASAFVLYGYLGYKTPVRLLSYAGMSNPAIAVSNVMHAVSSTTVKAVGNGFLTPPASAESSTRKILFTYRNPHAKTVLIRADFTGWKPDMMRKNANGLWNYQANLTPGEYAYCYSVDNKDPQKDPANKRTKVIGKAVVSAIVVEPLPAKPPK